MIIKRCAITAFAVCAFASVTISQTPQPEIDSRRETESLLKHRSDKPATQSANSNVDLTVPKGAALVVQLDREIRIKGVGQSVHGRTTEPIYAFDKLLIPAGTEVNGKISGIGGVSASKRTFAALDANLTPERSIAVEFTELRFADGKRVVIQTRVVPGSGQVLEFVTSAARKNKDGVREEVRRKEQEAKDQIHNAFDQVQQPGKLHRLERLTVAQLPIHPQYLDVGTVYFAELEQPLEFGSEQITPKMAATINAAVPTGSVIRASLSTALSSATTPKGAEVEAVLSQPLLSNDSVILPQGSLLKGSVVEVQPAGFWKHNGQLRFVFRDLVLPNGLDDKVQGIVQGVQASAADKLKIDSEGGAVPQTPKTRYLRSAVSVGLAAATHEDEAFNRAEGGAGGFKVVGIVVGASSGSQPLAIAMGAFGASRSIYNNFISRGRDVVFAKHTVMQIEIDTHDGPSIPNDSRKLATSPSTVVQVEKPNTVGKI
jgi:hypothetical protein